MKAILLDNGHGIDTRGKCSPDGKYKECLFSRAVVAEIAKQLTTLDIPHQVITPEDCDISLTERCKRVNKICGRAPMDYLLISVHTNAAGMGDKWMSARGVSAYCFPTSAEGNKKKAFRIAAEISAATGLPLFGSVIYQRNLQILRDSKCPAILTETGFHDNRDDCAFLLRDDAAYWVAHGHIEAIKHFVGYKNSTK